MSTTMDHKLAEKTGAVERYLLGETSAEERAEFEAHYFECPECADHVLKGSIFFDNARAVIREEKMEGSSLSEQASRFPEQNLRFGAVPKSASRDWFGWLKPAVLVPSFAALVMGTIVGYQNMVTLPALEQPQLLSAVQIAPQARDAGQVVEVDRHRPMFNINFPVDSPRAYPSYLCTFEKPQGGSPVLEMQSGPREFSSFTLGVLLPVSRFPDGAYTLTIRPSAERSRVIQRYTFTVRSGGSN